MKSINRRQALSLAAAGLAVPMLPSLARAAGTKIEIAFGNAYWKDMFEEVAAAFSKERPDIEVTLRPFSNEPELTQALLRDAVVGATPDIAFQGYGQMRTTVERGLALPLDELIAQETDWDRRGYVSSLSAMGQVGTDIYGIPFWASLPVMYYNLDMVERAGGNPDALPTDWPGILALSERLKAADGKQRFHYIYRNTDWNFQTLLFSEGGKMMSPDENSVAFAGTDGLNAFRLLEQFGRAGMVAMSRDQARQSFGAGDLGILGGNASSHLASIEKSAGGRFGVGVTVHPLPSANGSLPSGGGAFLILAKYEARRNAAWEFIKFASGPAGQTIMVKKTAALPISMAAISQKDALGDYYAQRPVERRLLDALPLLTAWYSFPGPNANRIVSEIEEHVEQAVTLKAPPAELLDSMKIKVEALLAA